MVGSLTRRPVAFELAVQDLDGVRIAERIGADRIELCAALAVGGLTPSAAFIAAAAARSVPVHVLIRPRAGDFAHSDGERDLIVADVRASVRAGAAGVVIGGIVDGGVDVPLVVAAVAAAEGREVTFHRAFDTLADRTAALEALADAGVARILTSGGASTAPEATDELGRLAAQADGRIQIMAGGGVTLGAVPGLVDAGVDAIHASAKRMLSGAGLALGSAGDAARETTDERAAAAFRAAVDAAAAAA